MKNILLLIFVVIFTSCSSSDDNDSSSKSLYNPPSWIQGTWGIAENEGFPENALLKFTSDDVCQLVQVTSMCWKEAIKNSPQILSGSDKSSDTTYEAKFVSGGSTTVTLSFKKVSATKILWVNNGSGDLDLVKLN